MSDHLLRARRIGLVSSVLGAAAGLVQLAVGTTVWTGNKNDPTTLGFVTVLLAVVIAAASPATPSIMTAGHSAAAAAALAGPALLGLTTAGAVWIPAALAACVAAGFTLADTRARGPLVPTIRRNWSAILLAILAATYLALGLALQGFAGLVGIAGAGAVAGAPAVRRRSHARSMALVLLGAVPFAVLTYWSVVTPLAAILMLALGRFALRTPTVDNPIPPRQPDALRRRRDGTFSPTRGHA
jgi:hypothetical protein